LSLVFFFVCCLVCFCLVRDNSKQIIFGWCGYFFVCGRDVWFLGMRGRSHNQACLLLSCVGGFLLGNDNKPLVEVCGGSIFLAVSVSAVVGVVSIGDGVFVGAVSFGVDVVGVFVFGVVVAVAAVVIVCILFTIFGVGIVVGVVGVAIFVVYCVRGIFCVVYCVRGVGTVASTIDSVVGTLFSTTGVLVVIRIVRVVERGRPFI